MFFSVLFLLLFPFLLPFLHLTKFFSFFLFCLTVGYIAQFPTFTEKHLTSRAIVFSQPLPHLVFTIETAPDQGANQPTFSKVVILKPGDFIPLPLPSTTLPQSTHASASVEPFVKNVFVTLTLDPSLYRGGVAVPSSGESNEEQLSEALHTISVLARLRDSFGGLSPETTLTFSLGKAVKEQNVQAVRPLSPFSMINMTSTAATSSEDSGDGDGDGNVKDGKDNRGDTNYTRVSFSRNQEYFTLALAFTRVSVREEEQDERILDRDDQDDQDEKANRNNSQLPIDSIFVITALPTLLREGELPNSSPFPLLLRLYGVRASLDAISSSTASDTSGETYEEITNASLPFCTQQRFLRFSLHAIDDATSHAQFPEIPLFDSSSASFSFASSVLSHALLNSDESLVFSGSYRVLPRDVVQAQTPAAVLGNIPGAGTYFSLRFTRPEQFPTQNLRPSVELLREEVGETLSHTYASTTGDEGGIEESEIITFSGISTSSLIVSEISSSPTNSASLLSSAAPKAICVATDHLLDSASSLTFYRQSTSGEALLPSSILSTGQDGRTIISLSTVDVGRVQMCEEWRSTQPLGTAVAEQAETSNVRTFAILFSPQMLTTSASSESVGGWVSRGSRHSSSSSTSSTSTTSTTSTTSIPSTASTCASASGTSTEIDLPEKPDPPGELADPSLSLEPYHAKFLTYSSSLATLARRTCCSAQTASQISIHDLFQVSTEGTGIEASGISLLFEAKIQTEQSGTFLTILHPDSYRPLLALSHQRETGSDEDENSEENSNSSKITVMSFTGVPGTSSAKATVTKFLLPAYTAPRWGNTSENTPTDVALQILLRFTSLSCREATEKVTICSIDVAFAANPAMEVIEEPNFDLRLRWEPIFSFDISLTTETFSHADEKVISTVLKRPEASELLFPREPVFSSLLEAGRGTAFELHARITPRGSGDVLLPLLLGPCSPLTGLFGSQKTTSVVDTALLSALTAGFHSRTPGFIGAVRVEYPSTPAEAFAIFRAHFDPSAHWKYGSTWEGTIISLALSQVLAGRMDIAGLWFVTQRLAPLSPSNALLRRFKSPFVAMKGQITPALSRDLPYLLENQADLEARERGLWRTDSFSTQSRTVMYLEFVRILYHTNHSDLRSLRRFTLL